MEKYKLVIEIPINVTSRKRIIVKRTFIWDNKDDALACKALLEKAQPLPMYEGLTYISFYAFTDPIQL